MYRRNLLITVLAVSISLALVSTATVMAATSETDCSGATPTMIGEILEDHNGSVTYHIEDEEEINNSPMVRKGKITGPVILEMVCWAENR